MPETISDQVPAWLQRNWTPKEPFDPSPWLQERYKRQIEAQTIPLKLQGLALQNARAELELKKQAMSNELQGQQLAQYSQELPMFNEAAKLASSDPGAFRNKPMSFRNVQLQQQYVGLRKMVAEGDYALAAEKKITTDFEKAAEIFKGTDGAVLVEPGPNGKFDPAALVAGGEAMQAAAAKKLAIVHPGPVDSILDLRTKMENAQTMGDNELADLYKARLTKLVQSTGTTITTNPDGTMTMTQGPLGSPDALTKANTTKVQTSMRDALDTVDTAKQLLPKLNEETVGARAAVENVVMDKILAQKFPELANKERAQASVLASSLRAKVVRMNKSDGNISEPERKEILKAFPRINDPLDSAANAKTMVVEATKLAATHAVKDALALKIPVPRAAALELDDETIARLYDSGVFTSEQAIAVGKAKRGMQ